MVIMSPPFVFSIHILPNSVHISADFMNEPEPSIWSNLQHNYKYLELNVYGDSNCEATCSIVT